MILCLNNEGTENKETEKISGDKFLQDFALLHLCEVLSKSLVYIVWF